jgi:acetyl-CoA synthetase
MKGIWNGEARAQSIYFDPAPGYFFTGDGARRDEDGDLWITGRIDDVVNVSGHRLGSAEIESVLSDHPAVAECAAIGIAHEVKGQAILAIIVLVRSRTDQPETLFDELRRRVRSQIGGLAVPERFVVVRDLPKTRSGKVLRRLLRKIAEGDRSALGDTTTFGDQALLDHIEEQMGT